MVELVGLINWLQMQLQLISPLLLFYVSFVSSPSLVYSLFIAVSCFVLDEGWYFCSFLCIETWVCLFRFFLGIISVQAGYIFWISYLVRFSGYLNSSCKVTWFLMNIKKKKEGKSRRIYDVDGCHVKAITSMRNLKFRFIWKQLFGYLHLFRSQVLSLWVRNYSHDCCMLPCIGLDRLSGPLLLVVIN